MKEFLHDLRAQLDYIKCYTLHMHTERHSFNIYVNFIPNLASFGKAHSKFASAKFNENAKFRPWIAPKCVWRTGSVTNSNF